jgi:hypothetical protein
LIVCEQGERRHYKHRVGQNANEQKCQKADYVRNQGEYVLRVPNDEYAQMDHERQDEDDETTELHTVSCLEASQV